MHDDSADCNNKNSANSPNQPSTVRVTELNDNSDKQNPDAIKTHALSKNVVQVGKFGQPNIHSNAGSNSF